MLYIAMLGHRLWHWVNIGLFAGKRLPVQPLRVYCMLKPDLPSCYIIIKKNDYIPGVSLVK